MLMDSCQFQGMYDNQKELRAHKRNGLKSILKIEKIDFFFFLLLYDISSSELSPLNASSKPIYY